MRKILSFLLLLQAVMVSFADAQAVKGRTIAGHVSDTNGSSAIGVTITEKGLRSNGTSTDDVGNFSITLKGTSNTLVISSVGFETQEVRVGTASTVRIVMKTANNSDAGEVVVVGYGRQKKITVTGAVSSISGKELRDNPTASLQNTLAGRLPGFFSQQTSGRPGGDAAQFFIRGTSSYNAGSNTALIIVDDIEFSFEQFQRLDPNEIETLSILKDASTTAIYGVRGANGVVIVTTRRGRVSRPQIAFRGEMAMMQPTKIPTFLNAYESARLFNVARANDGQPPYFTQNDLDLYKSGTDTFGHPDVDWKNELFRKFSRQYRGNFDISGGSDRVKYFISAGYLYQDGILKNFSKDQAVNNNYYHQRYNYRSNLDIKVTKTTDLRVDLYGNIGEINQPSVNSPFGRSDVFYEYSSFLSLAPFTYPIYNPDGTFGYSQWQRASNPGGSNYNTNNIIGRLTYNGYTRNFENNVNLVGTVNQKLDFLTKGLSAKATVSYASSYGNTRNETRNTFPSYIYNSAAKTYEPRDPNVFRVIRYFLAYGGGSTIRTLQTQLFLNYDRTFGNHRFYGLVLLNQNSDIRASGTAAYNFVPSNLRGLVGRVGYNFQQRYLVEFNAGYNGSDRFSKDNRFGFFPAASAGWNISEEKFFKNNIKVVDRLKLRGSYGLVGNDRIGNAFQYYYQQVYGTNGGIVNFGQQSNPLNGITEGTLGNDKVTWEKENKLDIGIEFAMFKSKLSVTADYFNNNRYDILTTRGTIAAVLGQSFPPVNLGRVNNRGFEIEASYNGAIGKNFTYNLRGTFSKAKNKILFQDEPTQLYNYQAITGKQIGQQLVYTFVGFYKDSADIAKSPKTASIAKPGDLKYADLNGDGMINGFDQSYQGYPTFPTSNAGLQIGLRYKNFGINAFFQSSMNYNAGVLAEAIRAFGSNLQYVHTQAWTPELGDRALYPRLSTLGGISDPLSFPSTFFFIRGDYIRLKTAEISYSLPKKWVSRMKMQDIRIYSNGYNLLTWTKFDKLYELDPEITNGNDRVNYPPQRTFNFGITATF